MATVITDFHELQAPRTDNMVGADNRKDWCCWTNLFYLLNDGSFTLGELGTGLTQKEFYFDTEVECHKQAAQYYKKHNRIYPYIDEWQAAIVAKATNSSNDSDIEESQVMVFI